MKNTHVEVDVFPIVHGNKLDRSQQGPAKVIEARVAIIRVITDVFHACVIRRAQPGIQGENRNDYSSDGWV